MDRTSYDYNVIDPQFPQLVRRDNKGHNTAERVQRQEFFRAVTALATSRPDWWFINYGYYGTNCTIWYDGEEIGELDYDDHSENFGLSCPAIRAAFQRKNWMHTKDPKKFLKAVIKNVKPTPLEQQWSQRASGGVSALNTISASGRSGAWYNMVSNQNDLLAFVALHAEQFKSVSPTFKADDFLRNIEVWSDAQRVQKSINDKNAVIVIKLGGGRYSICRAGSDTEEDGGEWKPYTDSDLPSNILEPLGIMKLMDKGKLLADYGYRFDDDTFILIPKEPEPCS